MEETIIDHDDPDTRYDPDLYELRDRLIKCLTYEDAGRFIDDQLSRVTTDEKETVIKSFFGLSSGFL